MDIATITSNGDVRLRALRHDLKPLRGFLAQYA